MLNSCPYCKEDLLYYNVDFEGYNHCPFCDKLIDNVEKDIPRCKICGRKLKTVESKQLGIGPTCYKKLVKSHTNKNKLF